MSAAIEGGARHAVERINLTLSGTAEANCRPVVVSTPQGQPAVVLEAPSPIALNLANLDLGYEGDDRSLSFTDTALEEAILRPTLCAQVMAPMAGLPLTYLPAPVPLRLAGGTGGADGLPFAGPAVALDPDGGSLTLTMRRPGQEPPENATLPPEAELAAGGEANAAVLLSAAGLNGALDWLCASGLATGTVEHPGGTPVTWRWTRLRATLSPTGVQLTGQLRRGRRPIVVDAELSCALDAGALSVRPSGPEPRPPDADLLAAAWAAVLRQVLFAGAGPELRQRFLIPGTDIAVEAPAVDLALGDGYLVARYALPLDEQRLAVTVEDAPPEPSIIQPIVPRQSAPGAPVTVAVSAVLAASPEPPYDYAWRLDGESRARPWHGSTLTVTVTPPPAVPTGDEPHRLAQVALTVIDLLGRVGRAEDQPPQDPPMLRPPQPRAPRHRPRAPRYPRMRSKVLATASAVIAVGVALIAVPSESAPIRGDRAAATTGASTPTATAPPTTSPPRSPSPSATGKRTASPRPTASPRRSTSARPARSPSARPRTTGPRVERTGAPSPRRTTPPPPPPLQLSLATSAGSCAPAQTCDPAPECSTCSTTFTGDCTDGVTVNFLTTISINRGPATVTFRWNINGSVFPTDTVEFTGTGAQRQTVGQVGVHDFPSTWTAHLEVLSPRAVTSNVATAQINCTGG